MISPSEGGHGYECGYCGGPVEWEESVGMYVHATDAPWPNERIRDISPGDFVSAAHNVEGTRVNPADVVPILCTDVCEDTHD